MEKIKIVLLFRPDNEKQRIVGEFLKTQLRCKTALITELVYDWLQNKDTPEERGAFKLLEDDGIFEQVKASLLEDAAFLENLARQLNTEPSQTGTTDAPDDSHSEAEEQEETETQLDRDEDMLLAGLSIFEMGR